MVPALLFLILVAIIGNGMDANAREARRREDEILARIDRDEPIGDGWDGYGD